ncbi:hypothetical protein F9L33_10015 [Amylibacter sp. SFDW26]|uniref:hypothetical protein n=1 Tax=Amylibacter sp. SFDW26 TaxID=2652722 RepID=UPI00126261FC|nr:hypothetical protein [Amylibacter sp. SFDW26]KAB7613700.1 hypothetical protein F9L33_10015 [Amylibacter sp. SFDW26]
MLNGKSDINLDDLRPLTSAEEQLIECCRNGQHLFIGYIVPDTATDENTIRAPLIRHLLLGGCEQAPAHAKGVQILGGYITEELDFEYGETDLPLALHKCRIVASMNFDDSRIRSLFLAGSRISDIGLERAIVKKELYLNEGLYADGDVTLRSTQIGGVLSCIGGHFSKGLDGDKLTVKQSVFLRDGFHSDGDVILRGADIGGQLDCSGGHFAKELNGNGLTVKQSVFLGDGFHSDGDVDLRSADIGGQLDCSGGHFAKELNGNGLTVKQSVFLREGFHSDGDVTLRGAHIGGQLACSGGNFTKGLNGNGLTVKQDVFLREGFHSDGDVTLRGAHIGGQLACSGGNFTKGLDGDKLTVKQGVFLRDGFHSDGDVDLSGAHIGGQLACSGGHFAKGLDGDGLTVKGSFFWCNVVECRGEINLMQAHVHVLVDDLASWRKASGLRMNGFRYDALESPDLDVYGRIGWIAQSIGVNRSTESEWTKAMGRKPRVKYYPQPYRQLAAIFQKQGHIRSAAKVREAAEDHRWDSENDRILAAYDGSCAAAFREFRPALRRFMAHVMKLLVGYGHAPFRAFAWAFGIILFAILFFGQVYQAGQMAPNSDVILTSMDWRVIADEEAHKNPAEIWSSSKAGKDYETFSATGYGIDLFIPLDALGQEIAWAPSKDRGAWGEAGFYLRWVVQFMGWVITAVGAAALTGLIGRRQD